MVFLGINFKKSPYPHVGDHRNRSTRQVTALFVLEIIFGTHVVRRRKREGHTTLQKHFTIPNVRKCQFINFIISFLRPFKENFGNRDSENFSSFNYCGEKKNAVSNFKKVISGTHNTSLESA